MTIHGLYQMKQLKEFFLLQFLFQSPIMSVDIIIESAYLFSSHWRLDMTSPYLVQIIPAIKKLHITFQSFLWIEYVVDLEIGNNSFALLKTFNIFLIRKFLFQSLEMIVNNKESWRLELKVPPKDHSPLREHIKFYSYTAMTMESFKDIFDVIVSYSLTIIIIFIDGPDTFF